MKFRRGYSTPNRLLLALDDRDVDDIDIWCDPREIREGLSPHLTGFEFN